MKPTGQSCTITFTQVFLCLFSLVAFDCVAQSTNAEALVIKFKSIKFPKDQWSYHLQSAENQAIQLELKTNGRSWKVTTFNLPGGMPQLLSTAKLAVAELGTNQLSGQFKKPIWEVSIAVSNGPVVEQAIIPDEMNELADFLHSRPSFRKLITSTERHVPGEYRILHDPEYTPGFFAPPGSLFAPK